MSRRSETRCLSIARVSGGTWEPETTALRSWVRIGGGTAAMVGGCLGYSVWCGDVSASWRRCLGLVLL